MRNIYVKCKGNPINTPGFWHHKENTGENLLVKIRSNGEYSIIHSSGMLWSNRRFNVAFTGQSKVRTVNFLKCYISNSFMSSFLR